LFVEGANAQWMLPAVIVKRFSPFCSSSIWPAKTTTIAA
jgi:hypothetical protein